MKITDKIANEMQIPKYKNNLYSFQIFFASIDVNRTSVKVLLQH